MNHPYLVIYSPSGSNAAEQALKAAEAKTAAGLCPICHDPFEVLTPLYAYALHPQMSRPLGVASGAPHSGTWA